MGVIYGGSGGGGDTGVTTTRKNNKVYLDVNADVSISNDVKVDPATGSAAINKTTAIAAAFKLTKILVHFDSAPTTSENLVVTLDSGAGAAYDTVLYSVDPSASSLTDIVYTPDGECSLVSGDEIKVAFTNTDTVTYGVSIYYEEL